LFSEPVTSVTDEEIFALACPRPGGVREDQIVDLEVNV